MKSLIIAFAMYSKFPMPRVDWEKKALSWALCWFPLVGLAVGAVLWLWLALAGWLGFGAVFTAALALLLPIALSGGIHLDGFCDTCDALSSHQSRERKLEILKDSHTGAFAIICCGLYLLVFFAAWCEAAPRGGGPPWRWPWGRPSPAASPASSPSPSPRPGHRPAGHLHRPHGRGQGPGSAGGVGRPHRRGHGGRGCADGLAALAGAGLACVYYVVTARRQFGGVTGDLAGFFLQLCELGMVLCAAVGQRLEVLL